jgi:hypothetical protein
MSKTEESAYSWTVGILDMMVVREQEASLYLLCLYYLLRIKHHGHEDWLTTSGQVSTPTSHRNRITRECRINEMSKEGRCRCTSELINNHDHNQVLRAIEKTESPSPFALAEPETKAGDAGHCIQDCSNLDDLKTNLQREHEMK